MDGFLNSKKGRLAYRTLRFERFDASGDYQGNSVINYCEEQIPNTRIAEHKHFSPREEHAETVCFREYSALCENNDTPYYPLRLNEDKKRLEDYVQLAVQEEKVTFIGRLGNYRYLDMHVVIGETLDLAKQCLKLDAKMWPKFSQRSI